MIDGLQVSELLKYIDETKFGRYFPDVRDWVHVDRKWLCDVLYSIDNLKFDIFVDKCIENKRKKIDTAKGLVVPIRSEFAEALKNATSFSSKWLGPYFFCHGQIPKAIILEALTYLNSSLGSSKGRLP
jgi:hypothetical protein